jgi:hypothetical protein
MGNGGVGVALGRSESAVNGALIAPAPDRFVFAKCTRVCDALHLRQSDGGRVRLPPPGLDSSITKRSDTEPRDGRVDHGPKPVDGDGGRREAPPEPITISQSGYAARLSSSVFLNCNSNSMGLT